MGEWGEQTDEHICKNSREQLYREFLYVAALCLDGLYCEACRVAIFHSFVVKRWHGVTHTVLLSIIRLGIITILTDVTIVFARFCY